MHLLPIFSPNFSVPQFAMGGVAEEQIVAFSHWQTHNRPLQIIDRKSVEERKGFFVTSAVLRFRFPCGARQSDYSDS